jgi:hypothetical protein
MKKILVLFVLILNFIFGKSFESIESISSNVDEKTFVNGEWKEKKYKLKIKYPDFVLKEVIEPKLNSGEKILYKYDKKYMYYPIFDEIFEEELDGEENYILATIKIIKEKNIEKDENIMEILLDTGIKLIFYDYVLYGDIYFPKKVEAYDMDEKVSEVYFNDVMLNEEYDESDFKIGIE